MIEEKFKQSESKDIKKVGKDIKKFEASKEIFLMFKENRSFELHAGRKTYRFNGRETLKVPASVLTDKNFTEKTARKFVIKEVN